MQTFNQAMSLFRSYNIYILTYISVDGSNRSHCLIPSSVVRVVQEFYHRTLEG